MIRPVRRIVTGRDENGKSRVLIDEPASTRWEHADWPGLGATQMWVSDKTPADNSGSEDATARPFRGEPPVGGVSFMVVQFPPESDLDKMTPEEVKRIKDPSHGSGLGSVDVDPDGPAGMHATRTLDYDLVLSGKLTLVLDHEEVELSAGDVVVLRGDRHTWENRSDEPAVMAVIMVDAETLA